MWVAQGPVTFYAEPGVSIQANVSVPESVPNPALRLDLIGYTITP
jgi:hypothetical protein